MKKIWLSCFAAALFLFSGCVSDQDQLFPSDITLKELETRINKASDPDGLFAASKSYIMRQEVRTKVFLDEDNITMVEVKFEKPDKLALITYSDNREASIFCTDGQKGWIADCKSRKIVQLEKKGLERMQMLASLSRPGSGGYEAVFPKVELHKCENKDGDFYRITCYPANQEHPIFFYVDEDDYLLRRIKMKVEVDGKTFDYENRIIEYETREGVNIPMQTQVEQMGISQECRVILYRLNPEIPASDFLPPVF